MPCRMRCYLEFLPTTALPELISLLTERHSWDCSVLRRWHAVSRQGATTDLCAVLFRMGGYFGTRVGGPFADRDALDDILAAAVGLGIACALGLVRLDRIEQPTAAAS